MSVILLERGMTAAAFDDYLAASSETSQRYVLAAISTMSGGPCVGASIALMLRYLMVLEDI